MKSATRQYDILACLLLIVAVGALFAPLWLTPGKLFTAEMTAASHYANSDFIRAELAAGRGLPLWNPYLFGGVTFYSYLTVYLAYPVYWVYFALPPLDAQYVAYSAPCFVAALGAYAYCRNVGVGVGGALIGGLAFGLSGPFADNLFHGHREYGSAFGWTPWLFLALERLIERPSLGRGAALGGGVALTMVLANPQYPAILLIGLGLRLLFENARSASGGWRRQSAALLRLDAAFVGSLAIAIAAAAVYLLPTAELMGLIESSGKVNYAYLSNNSVHPFELVGLLFPDAFGHEMDGDFWRGIYCENPLYIGVLPALLAALALSRWRRDRTVAFMLLLAAATLLIAFGKYTPLYRLVALAPPFSFARDPARFTPLFTFALAVLAAKGAGLTFDMPNGVSSFGGSRWLVGAIAACLGVALVAALALTSRGIGATTMDDLARQWERLDMAAVLVPAALGLVALVLLGAGMRLRARWRRVALALAVLLTFADLWLFGSQFIRPAELATQFPQRAYAGQLPVGGDGARVYSEWAALSEWESQAQRVPNAGGLNPFAMKRYVELLRVAYGGRPPDGVAGHLPQSPAPNPAPRLMDVLGVGYYVYAADGAEAVSVRPTALPRAYLVADYMVAATAAIATLTSDAFEPRRSVVLAPAPSVGGLGPLGPLGRDDSARIVDYAPNRVVIETRSFGAAILVLADAYHPGWRASVDDAEAALLRANHALRAVVVPAGEHRVEFAFRPTLFYVGAAVSAAAWLFVAGVAIARLSRRRALEIVA